MFQSTPKQAAASRANSQKSTGPRTTAGKAASRFNALKHGIYAVHQIMFDETPEDLAELSDEYHELCNPADSKQRFHVDAMVHNEWRLRRIRRVEAALWQTASNTFLVKNIEVTSTCTSGDAFATDSGTFERLQRVANACERAYHRASHELERLQAQTKLGQALSSDNVPVNPGAAHSETEPEPKPAAPAPPPQPEQSKPASSSSASFRQNSQKPAPQPAPASPEAPANPAKNAMCTETQPTPSDGFPTPPTPAKPAIKPR
jgi:hypothetical protein